MGMIICEKHGRQGIATNILKEISKKIRCDEDLEDEELEIVIETLILGEFGSEILKYLITKQFAINNSIPKYIETDEKTEHIMNKKLYTKMGVICISCLKEYINKRNLKQGKLYEFMSFETKSDNI